MSDLQIMCLIGLSGAIWIGGSIILLFGKDKPMLAAIWFLSPLVFGAIFGGSL